MEYAQMPPVFNFDRYGICINQKDGIYCTINIDLVTDEESDLFNIIQEYSERKETHYNHTRLFHGVCEKEANEQRTAKKNKWLLCFSVKQNWRRLTAPTRNGSKRRVTRLFGLNGMRFKFVRALFRNDPTFNAYRRTHTNISCYITGLSLGLLISKLQKKKMNTKVSAKYKYLYWAIVPIGIAVILTSGIFYMDGVVAPLIYKAIHSSALRAVAGILLSAIILGMVLRIEDTYRGILEWRGWTTPERLCYSAYLLHLIVIQILTGTRTTLIYITEFQMTIINPKLDNAVTGQS
ncbi:hypothetical protein RR48_13135 [Papilio machaon]|uniref:Nose resistant to fluoxetine protein 6 n=1 Tax=Papilio machaon TaxID=76193 RepID=A0A194R0Y1_PAPMA|nr:hypothetical protein RR48_13135 [Papilio machaon]